MRLYPLGWKLRRMGFCVQPLGVVTFKVKEISPDRERLYG